MNLATAERRARPWIEGRALRTMGGDPKQLMWVKGRSGVKGKGEADRRVKSTAIVGRLMRQPSIAAPAGIRQTYRLPRGTSTMNPADSHLGQGRTEGPHVHGQGTDEFFFFLNTHYSYAIPLRGL